jgi:hypothetical protein
VGKKFVVCDAGGGTVDLITYEIARLNKLELKEMTEGTGGKCGSSILNQRFRRYLKRTHGEEYWTDDRLVEALNEFETVYDILQDRHILHKITDMKTVQEGVAPWRRAPDTAGRPKLES